MKKFVLAALSVLALSTAAQADDGVCTIVIDRTPCKGKDAEVYKPYAGKNPTTETRPKAKTAEECLKEGEKSAKIVRRGAIIKKFVKVSLGGKEIGTKEDTSDQCDK